MKLFDSADALVEFLCTGVKRNRGIVADVGLVIQLSEEAVGLGHISSIFPQGLGQVVGQILVQILAGNDHALHAEGVDGLILDGLAGGVGAGRDVDLRIGRVDFQSLVQLFIGEAKPYAFLGGSSIQLSADRDTGESGTDKDGAVSSASNDSTSISLTVFSLLIYSLLSILFYRHMIRKAQCTAVMCRENSPVTGFNG